MLAETFTPRLKIIYGKCTFNHLKYFCDVNTFMLQEWFLALSFYTKLCYHNLCMFINIFVKDEILIVIFFARQKKIVSKLKGCLLHHVASALWVEHAFALIIFTVHCFAAIMHVFSVRNFFTAFEFKSQRVRYIFRQLLFLRMLLSWNSWLTCYIQCLHFMLPCIAYDWNRISFHDEFSLKFPQI